MEMQIQAVLGQWAKLREAVHSDTIRIEKTARILKVISAADTVLCAHDVCVCVCGWLCVCVCLGVCVCVCLGVCMTDRLTGVGGISYDICCVQERYAEHSL